MKSLNVIFSLVAFLEASGIVLAIPTWPSPTTDELEDIMLLNAGYDKRVSKLRISLTFSNTDRASPTS